MSARRLHHFSSGVPEVPPGLGPPLPSEVPQPHRVPSRSRGWVLLDEVMSKHEERGSQSMDVVHTCEVKGESRLVSRNAIEDSAALAKLTSTLGGPTLR